MSKKAIFLSVITIASIVLDVFCLIGTMLLGLPPQLIDVMMVVSAVAIFIVAIVLLGSMLFKFLYIAAAATATYQGAALLITGGVVGIVLLIIGVVMTIFIPKLVFKAVK